MSLITTDLIARSWDFADKLIKGPIKNHLNEPHEVRKIAFGKMAECEVALWLGIDPVDHLDWYNEKKRGEGHDIEFGSWKLEVKHAFSPGRLLMWRVGKNNKFFDMDFNAFVLVLGDEPEGLTIIGVMKKDRFFDEKVVSQGERGIIKGTWYIDRDRLANPTRLLEAAAERRCHCGERAPFGVGYSSRSGRLGRWFCRTHRPSDLLAGDQVVGVDHPLVASERDKLSADVNGDVVAGEQQDSVRHQSPKGGHDLTQGRLL